jgi:hypothetical protein
MNQGSFFLLIFIVLIIINKYYHTSTLQTMNPIGTNKVWIYHDSTLQSSEFEKACLQTLQRNITGVIHDLIIITPDNIQKYVPDFPISMNNGEIPYRKKIDLLYSFLLDKYGGLCISPGTIGINIISILSNTHTYDLVTVGGNPKIIQSNKNHKTPNTYIIGSKQGSRLIREYKHRLLSTIQNSNIYSYDILKNLIDKYNPLQYHISNDGTTNSNEKLLVLNDYIGAMNPGIIEDNLFVISLPYEQFHNINYQWLFKLSKDELQHSQLFILKYVS